jgi:hypothetical protein
MGSRSGRVVVVPLERRGQCGHFGTRVAVAVAMARWQWSVENLLKILEI